MEYVELNDESIKDSLNLKDDEWVFNYLVMNYEDESADALFDLCDVDSVFDLVQFFNIYEYGDLIEVIDDYIDEDILVNYYIRDYCPTDWGVLKMIVSLGYRVK